MYWKQIWDEWILTIEDTNTPDTKTLTYITPISEWTGQVEASVALQLEQSDIILQPDWLTNVCHEVMRLLDN